jgi:hypothetical protein
MVASFMSLGHERMATRYCHLHPNTDKEALLTWFKYQPKYFHWAGADLFTVTKYVFSDLMPFCILNLAMQRARSTTNDRY